MIKHTKNEFTLDFAFRVDLEAHFLARIISSPEHTKSLAQVLNASIEKYEKTYGEIKLTRNTKKG